MDFTSSRILLQYGQFVLSGRFHQFDHLNSTLNYQTYSQETAPDYPIDKLTPNNLVLFIGQNDLLCDSKDVDTLLSKVKGKINKELSIAIIKMMAYFYS